jgi:chemotaxis signal transduction protein
MNRSQPLLSDQYCVCSIGGTGIAVPALGVREIMERPEVFAVPASGPILVGLCHVRNEFVPVVSISHVLGQDHAVDARRESLVVMNGAEGPWAFTIDRAHAVEPLETAHVRDAAGDDELSSIVTGTATFREGVVRVLDTESLYRIAVGVLTDEWNA